MGGAIAKSVLEQDIVSHISIIDPANTLPHNLQTHDSVSHNKTLQNSEISDVTACLLAVKPQYMKEACTDLGRILNDDTLMLSIAAGKTIEAFEKMFGAHQPIIRAMPNTPAMIGEGISVLCANQAATDQHKESANQLLSTCGAVKWLDDETLMDAVTAISGSGPAYLFYFIECLEKAALARGLEPNLAKELARQTVIGASALAKHQTNENISALRENVTSKGGTTAAALDILMEGEFSEVLEKATSAAEQRGKELSN